MCLRFLFEVFQQPQNVLHYCVTDCQAADIFTKNFPDQPKWLAALALIGMFVKGMDSFK